MLKQILRLPFLDALRGYGPLLLRLLVGYYLIQGSQDNVFSHARMLEFRDFLAERNVPFPLISAHLSVYAQFICGILFIVGAFARQAGFVMVVNFIAALIIAHIGTPFNANFPAFVMLAGAWLFMLDGYGRLSVDGWRSRGAARS